MSLLRDCDLLLLLDGIGDILFVLGRVGVRVRVLLLLGMRVRVREIEKVGVEVLDGIIIRLCVTEAVCETDPVPVADGLADAVCDALGVPVSD